MRKVKKTIDVGVTFKCNFCPRIAGQALYHGLALDRARYTAREEGWKWFSDDEWGLMCPDCLADSPNRQTHTEGNKNDDK